ncbi:hypothetical protein AB7W89_18355 [Providencia rettgeri]
MEGEKEKVKIFYSWQSSYDERKNRFYIRDALTKAVTHLNEKQSTFIYEWDQATDYSSGSPDILATILAKISASQIVISDVTVIPQNGTPKNEFPNPNVMFELGFAVAKIGWGRIITLLNSSEGHGPKDLPFDINKQRVSLYNSNRDDGKKNLEKLLIFAIELITSNNPAYPNESDPAITEKIKRQSDINTLTGLMNYLDTNILDYYFEALPNIMYFDGSTCWESFRAIFKSSAFYLYDTTTFKILNNIYENRSQLVEAGQFFYDHHQNGLDYIFPGRKRYESSDAQMAWDVIGSLSMSLQMELASLIENLKNKFPEIDINKTNSEGRKDIIRSRP